MLLLLIIQKSLPLPLQNLKNLKYGRLSDKNTKIYYVRDDTIKLWKNLDSLSLSGDKEVNRAMWIDVSPVVGKSTTLFGWAMHKAK